MIQDIIGDFKIIFIESIQKLTGSEKRVLLAKTAKAIGKGGQTVVSKEFHVSRDTIRKGHHELATGKPIEDNFQA